MKIKRESAKPLLHPIHRVLSTLGLIATGIAITSGTASAVQPSINGSGQVLLFPYYSVRPAGGDGGDYNTLLSIANTTAEYKALKVRFREAKTGEEVNELNVFLSPNDSWVAAVIPTTTGARLVTNDNSCVTPADFFTAAGRDLFRPVDSTTAAMDRVREGYIEVIEMGTITSTTVQGHMARNAALVPANCTAIGALDPATGTAPNVFPGNFLAAPGGGLSGRVTLLNPVTGINFSYVPTALEAWSNVVRYGGVRSGAPLLGAASPPETRTLLEDGRVLHSVWATGLEAVSAALMSDGVVNEFILDSGTNSLTDWVVTFPTYYEHFKTSASNPYSNPSSPQLPAGCIPSGWPTTNSESRLAMVNREEGAPGCSPNLNPTVPRLSCGVLTLNHCSVANVVAYGNRSLLNSTSQTIVSDRARSFFQAATTTAASTTSVPGQVNGPNGTAELVFDWTNTQRLAPVSSTLDGVAVSSVAILGVPVISIGMHTYTRTGVVSTYGGVIPGTHRLKLQF
ncbi:MAG: hypothetical protein JNN20_09920 [Betaproteobacteria bacterium]|nr:hypothetical protein [Betaproteobacteria bacterium]